MMITDEAGSPLAVTDLNGAELRALRVLAAAGMIPPPDEPADGQGVLVERDFTRTPRKASLKPPRQGTTPSRQGATPSRQGTTTARPAAKAS